MLNGRILWNDIRDIRYITMTQGKPMIILFPSDSPNRYIIAYGNNTIKTVYMDEGIEIFHNSRKNVIQFSLSGTSIEKSAGTIRVFDTKTKKFVEITITPCTGRILLKDKIFEGFTKYK